MPTPEKLRALADEADAEAAKLEAEAEGIPPKLRAQAAVLRRQAIDLRRVAAAGDEGLRSMYPEGTVGVGKMEARENASAGAKKAWAKIKHRWPLQVALFRRGLSLPEWARAQKRPSLAVETAKAWLKRKGHGGHRIPEDWARRIAKEFTDEKGASEVPAVDASWPCGIRPPSV